ncbi:hypothetical protein Tco_0621564, partial [Tanacetum coccineum]
MADNRTMAQMLQAPIEGYEDAIVVPPINANNFELKQPLINLVQSNKFTELHQLDTFYNSLNSNDQDALDSAAGGNFLDKMPQEGLAIIESKSKVRYSRSRANDSRLLVCMERGFLSPKGSGGGRGVKEKIGGSVDVSTKVNNGVDEGTTTSSNVAMNTQNPTANADANVVISPTGPISSAPTSNNWGKYGLVKSTLNSSTRLFFLQFSSMDSLDSMLENGSWLNSMVSTTFSEDGLSTIATKLDTTLMLDSYTYDISMQSWGRSSYARAMIELRADV